MRYLMYSSTTTVIFESRELRTPNALDCFPCNHWVSQDLISRSLLFPPDDPFVTSQTDWLVHSQWKQGASNTLPLFTQAPHPPLPSLEHRLPPPHPEASSPPAACSDSPRAARPYSDSWPSLRRSSARPNRCASGTVSYGRGCWEAGIT
jgi:hypothetical protein